MRHLSAAQQAQMDNRDSTGQWKQKTHGDVEDTSSVLGIESGSDVVDVEPGDSYEVYSDHSGAGPFDSVEVTVSDDGVYSAFGTRYEDFSHCIPRATGKFFDEEQRQRYLDDRHHVIEDFVKDRYPNVDIDPGSDIPRLEFHTELGERAPTEDQAAEAVWENSSGVDFANEMDPGTFGVEDASAMLSQRLAAYDRQKLAHHGPVDEDDVSDMQNAAARTLVEDVRANYNDGAYSEDGEPPEQPLDELELSEDATRVLNERVDDFARANYGDLKALSEATGRDMDDMGSDIYLEGAGHGVGFIDRVPPTEADRVIADRLSESAISELDQPFENAHIGDDGKVHL